LKLYKKWKNEKIAGESSATYLCSKTSAQEIRRFNAASKIIMIFREPVEFLHLFHSAARFALGEHIEDFETAIAAEKDRRKGRGFGKRVITPSWLFYSKFAKYSEKTNRFRSYSIRRKDDFRTNTPGIYQEVLQFLSVEPNVSPPFEIVNPNKQLRWPLLKKYTLDSPYFRLKDFYRSKMVKYASRQPLEEAFKLKLMQQFKPEVEKLSDFLKKDLVSKWEYDKV
jgi:hypothetical protein